jgi:hypothetical protein
LLVLVRTVSLSAMTTTDEGDAAAGAAATAEEDQGLFAGLHLAHSTKSNSTAKSESAVASSPTQNATKEPVENISPPLAAAVVTAPVTDKLLAMLGTPPSSPQPEARKDYVEEEKPVPAADSDSDSAEQVEQPHVNGSSRTHDAHGAPPSNYDDERKVAAATSHAPAEPSSEEEERKPTASVAAEAVASLTLPVLQDETKLPVETTFTHQQESAKDEDERKPAAKESPKERESRRQAQMEEIEEAFHVITNEEVRVATVGQVHPDTPIPNADAALRLLRKFASKTQPRIPKDSGGKQNQSWSNFLFGSRKQDPTMEPYAQLIQILFDGEEEQQTQVNEVVDNDIVVESILGYGGDTAAKARLAVAAFCHTSSVWCHVSSRMLDESKSFLLGHAMDTATALVARGCMDNVMIGVGGSDEYNQAVEVLAESIFVADLSDERNELAALKFLLTTGCRSSEGQALLRGTHLLQSIRVLYHVYLTTDSKHNKTTARAALQQLVTSVFMRMIISQDEHTSEDGESTSNKNSFSSPDHRDSFLVLRTLCKLSMKTLQDTSKNSHTGGLQSSGSNLVWDAKDSSRDEQGEVPPSPGRPSPQIIAEKAMNSALESKILALELLLYVLQNTDMSGAFMHHSGSPFQFAIRNYLCVSLLKNCTSDNTTVVNLSLRLFVPLIRNFRTHLKTEIEAFVTNVFFVILDSKNSTIEHKIRVAILFEEICSDPTTLAEIFLNYDCDLSAVDLFHRIVNTLSRVAKTDEPIKSHFVAGAGAARMEKMRKEQRELRLYAMRALKQVLASLHHSIVDFGGTNHNAPAIAIDAQESNGDDSTHSSPIRVKPPADNVTSFDSESGKKTLVQIYDSKKKRRQEESEVVLRFNRKPSAGIAYAVQCGHIDGDSHEEVARFLLKNKDVLEKTQIGECLGREKEYQNGFALRVLHSYVNMLDFSGLAFDEAIRYYLSGFRLPGEAQKIDRIMEKFAERYTNQNPTVFPTADAAFILAFSIIMLNTDLHNPAIKEDRRMTKEGFIRNNRGICDGLDLPEELLYSIFDRIKSDPISLKEDDEARKRVGDTKVGMAAAGTGLPSALSPGVFFSSHYDEIDRARETNFQKERDHIVRTTETLLRRKRHQSVDHGKSHARHHQYGKLKSSVKFVRTVDTGLRDEYVTPMFEVTWAPALAAFSTAMESANGTLGALLNIATDEELESAAENAAETTEVCLTGFQLAICTGGLCGNDTARDAFVLALVSFSQLGTGRLLEHRHVRCIQSLLSLGRDDGELLGNTWEHIFKALSEIHRFHEVFQLMARNDRAAAAAVERRRQRVEAQARKQEERERRRRDAEAQDDSIATVSSGDASSDCEESLTDSEEFSDDEPYFYDQQMDKLALDQANARVIHEAIPESLVDAIYQRSSSLSGPAIIDFIFQLCRVSRMEISGYGGHVGSNANEIDLTQVHYRQQHTLLNASGHGRSDKLHHNQPNIYNLQKLVEATHYNMDSRPRLVFSEIWTTVAAHLTSTALHENAAVAMYAVDSFRQLSFQYLQREELGVFEFQSRFLKPLESVMARSSQVITKELLLNCIERIILMFGGDKMFGGDTEKSSASPTRSNARHLGTLRSGWRPVLAVLGIAGHDEDEGIATTGFKLLTGQLNQCLSGGNNECGEEKSHAGVLVEERFVDLVDALLMYVSGPHEEMSAVAIDHLVTLSCFLADDKFALPVVRRCSIGGSSVAPTSAENAETESNRELALWWPILLGLSRSVGEPRKCIRLKSLESLFGIINRHFLPATTSDEERTENLEASVSRNPRHGDLQTLQIIFRGVLTPILENAESDSGLSANPPVPEGFVRFFTKPPLPPDPDVEQTSWLATTFQPFMDSCVAVCMRPIEAFKDETLIEEVFAILNSCLLSDSGVLAVRGLRRMQQFLSDDLDETAITDDTYATACHMLRRCLLVRGLTTSVLKRTATSSSTDGKEQASAGENEKTQEDRTEVSEVSEAVTEFVADEELFADRRYIGSNATMVIGAMLDEEEKLGLRWYFFLTKGLGRGIKEWELAAEVLDAHASTERGRHGP